MSRSTYRLERIEKQLRGSSRLGWKNFYTLDMTTFYEQPSGTDYRLLIPEAEEEQPEGALSRADLDALEEQGWELMIIHYCDLPR